MHGLDCWAQYETYAEADFKWIAAQRARRPRLRLFWATTNPLGFVAEFGGLSLYTSPPTEFRTDPLIAAYNARAKALAARHGVGVLDGYEVARALKDLSYEHSHYQGAVGWTIANLALTAICGKG